MSFHHRMMAALDAFQMSGRWIEAQHGPMRAALRKANMRGAQITSAEQLAEALMG